VSYGTTVPMILYARLVERIFPTLTLTAKQSPQPGEEQSPPATTPSVERKGEILDQAIIHTHTGPAAAANRESNQQCSPLWQTPFEDETSQSVAVKVWSDVLQAAVWVVRDNLPRTEWPQDGPVYTHGEIRMLIKVGQDVLQWVNPVKEIFNAKVVAAHSAPKTSPACCRHQQNVDL
jgi:hypothetical protein